MCSPLRPKKPSGLRNVATYIYTAYVKGILSLCGGTGLLKLKIPDDLTTDKHPPRIAKRFDIDT